MIKKLKGLLLTRREVVAYIFFGVLTTLVNFVCYFALRSLFREAATPAINIPAQAASVLFAYFTNRKWVFESKSAGAGMLREMLAFFAARIFSVLLDIALVFLTVDILRLHEGIMKISVTFLVVVLNYFLSKFFIFNKKG
jgi:putative flippase GtrA